MNEGEVATRLGLRGQPPQAESAMVARDHRAGRVDRRSLPRGPRLHRPHHRAGPRGQAPRPAGVVRGHAAPPRPHRRGLRRAGGLRHLHEGQRRRCRTADDLAALREGLADGTIDCIATDHAPHSTVEKDVEFDRAAFGMLGLETALPLVLELGREEVIDLARGGGAGHRAAGPAVRARPRRRRRARAGARPPTSRCSTSIARGPWPPSAALALAQHAVPGARHARRRAPDPVRRPPHLRPRRAGERMSERSEQTRSRPPALLVLENGRVFEGTGVRRPGRDRGRGGVQHRPHRLPGDPHRSVLRRTDRGHDRATDRQHRRQRPRPRGGRAGLRRPGGARGLADLVELAVAGAPRALHGRARPGRHRGHRHPRAHPGPARPGRHARRHLHHHPRPQGAARAGPGVAGDGRPRPGAAGHLPGALPVGRAQLALQRPGRVRVRGPAGRPARGRLRLRRQAQHPQAAARRRLPGHGGARHHPGRRGPGPGRRRLLPVQRPRRPRRRHLRGRGGARAGRERRAGVRHLSGPPRSCRWPLAPPPTSSGSAITAATTRCWTSPAARSPSPRRTTASRWRPTRCRTAAR